MKTLSALFFSISFCLISACGNNSLELDDSLIQDMTKFIKGNGLPERCDTFEDDNENGYANHYLEKPIGCKDLYADEDDDGFGHGEPRCMCSPSEEFTAFIGGDCEDLDGDINPDVKEIPDNDIDENCDGSLFLAEGKFFKIAAGYDTTCAIRTKDGSVTCWGLNDAGQTDGPSDEEKNTKFVEISVSRYHSCAISEQRHIVCWGRNEYGQSDVPEEYSDLSFEQVSVGALGTCARSSSGSVVCWGDDHDWNSHYAYVVPSHVKDTPFKWISTNWFDTCGVRQDDGKIVCWGENYHGQHDVPKEEEHTKFKQVSTSQMHTCGIRENDTMICWGLNRPDFHYHSLNDFGQEEVPASEIDTKFSYVTTNTWTTCGVREDDSVLCWGKSENYSKEIDLNRFTDFSAGNYHICGIETIKGDILCWGNDYSGQSPWRPE